MCDCPRCIPLYVLAQQFEYRRRGDVWIEVQHRNNSIHYILLAGGIEASRVYISDGYIGGMSTGPEHRRKGYATLLLNEIITDHIGEELYLTCGTKHFELYQKVGFLFPQQDGYEMIREA